ncbi:MAG: MATE family efflux transporter [Rhodobacteraceae bacterium]|nr:MATE family efflux transporter [Paracoccaceae bacterium]
MSDIPAPGPMSAQSADAAAPKTKPVRRHGGKRLTEGDVKRTILSLAGFMMLGSLATMTFQLADAYFVAQLGTGPLAALAFTFPVVMILHAIALGLGTGVTSVVARAYGHGDMPSARVLTSDSILLACVIALFFAVAGKLSIHPLFQLLGAKEDILLLVESYMNVWFFGMPFMVVPLIANAVIRAFGDAKAPSLIMAISAVINIILDPILIFGAFGIPQLGLMGAAIALLLARAFTFVASVFVLHYRMHALTYELPSLSRLKSSWGDLLHIGLPATGTQMITPFSSAILTSLIASFGAASIAAYGISTRIEMFSMIFVMGMSISIAPFVGQNAGAGRVDRVKEAMSFAHKATLVYGIAIAVLLFTAGRWIAGEFSDSPDVVSVAAFYLATVPISYGCMGIINTSSSCLNALAKPMPAMVIGMSKTLVLQIPFAYAGSYFFGIRGVFMGMAATTFVVAGIALFLVRRALNQPMTVGLGRRPGSATPS